MTRAADVGALPNLMDAIRALAQGENLAAVIVHINDTYSLEEHRVPTGLTIPGMARVAALIDAIRESVRAQTGEDRTLVLHSGDYLSPSYLSNKCNTYGRPIVELLSLCGLDYATLGNHEFDHDAPGNSNILMSILESPDTGFRTVASNLIPPRSSKSVLQLALWPKTDPYIGIIGLAGEETVKVARDHGFSAQDWEPALRAALDSVEAHPRIRCLVVLSHLSRVEDQALQRRLAAAWGKHGFAFLLGGHDHHVHWAELRGSVRFSKNLADCATITVVLVPQVFAAAPPRVWGDPPPQYLSREEEGRILREMELDPRLTFRLIRAKKGEKAWDERERLIAEIEHNQARDRAERRARNLPGIIDEAIAFYRDLAKPLTRTRFLEAYCRHIRDTAERFPSFAEDGPRELYMVARDNFLSDFRLGIVESDGDTYPGHGTQLFWSLPASELEAITPLSAAQQCIDGWQALKNRRIGPAAETIVVDFSEARAAGAQFECHDIELRKKSTNFGNFILDAVEIAANVDVALIHAGAFRSNRQFDGRLRVSDLLETFLYDSSEALAVIRLPANVISAMLAHARAEPGAGRFLQVSRGLAAALGRSDSDIRVAFPTYLIKNDQDGYRSLFIKHLSSDPLIEESHGIIDLVRRVAASVSYDAKLRVEAKTIAEDELWIEKLIALTDALIAALPWSRPDEPLTPAEISTWVADLKGYLYSYEQMGRNGEPLLPLFVDLYEHVQDLVSIDEWLRSGWPKRVEAMEEKIRSSEYVHVPKEVPYDRFFHEAAGWVSWYHDQHYRARVMARNQNP